MSKSSYNPAPAIFVHIWTGNRYGGKLHIYLNERDQSQFAFVISDIPTENMIEGTFTVNSELIASVEQAKDADIQRRYSEIVREKVIELIDNLYTQKCYADLENLKKHNPNFKVS